MGDVNAILGMRYECHEEEEEEEDEDNKYELEIGWGKYDGGVEDRQLYDV